MEGLMQFENWFMFCSIALLATATPGPAALLVSINSISFGFKKSLITVLGSWVKCSGFTFYGGVYCYKNIWGNLFGLFRLQALGKWCW
jgi:hypothetical protein